MNIKTSWCLVLPLNVCQSPISVKIFRVKRKKMNNTLYAYESTRKMVIYVDLLVNKYGDPKKS